MSVRRLSIFLPRKTEFYESLLRQMQRGFEACGVECTGGLGYLGPEDMKRWCREHRPQVVLEMNRSRRDAEFLPSDVRHVVWLVDLAGQTVDYFEGSDITYFFGPSWASGYSRGGLCRCLVPGTCPVDYAPLAATPVAELGFVGHIPKPWTDDELARDMTAQPGQLSFGDFLPPFEQAMREIWDPPPLPAWHVNRLTRRAVMDPCVDGQWFPITIAREVVTKICSAELHIADEKMRYDLLARVIRHLNRGDLAEAMIRTGRDVSFFGPDNWTEWPQFAPHYRGWLSGPAAMRDAYAQTRFNFHEGEGAHFRSMDILGSGNLLVFRGTNRDRAPGGLASMFEPGVHYISCRLDSLGETLAAANDNPDALAVMRREAAAEVKRRHTWQHRAEEILDDLQQVA